MESRKIKFQGKFLESRKVENWWIDENSLTEEKLKIDVVKKLILRKIP